jgi:hypothetical protein
MKPLLRKFAIVGILWAILMPILLFWREINDGHSMMLHVMASNLKLASNSASNGVVNIPTNGMSNWAGTIHDLAAAEGRRTDFFASVIGISSVIIIVLSVCALRICKKDKNFGG